MKTALIGLGRVGFDFSLERRPQPASHYGCLRYLQSKEKISHIAVSEVNQSKLNEVKQKVALSSAYVSYHNMLRRENPELVCIATPTSTHKTIACDVASHSSVKGIFLEKPIAESLNDADEIIETCRENNVALSVNYERRWNPIYQSLKKQDKPIIMIGYHPGPLLRTGSHMVDLFNYFLEEPVTAQFAGYITPNYLTEKGDLDDFSLSGTFTYPNREAWLLAGISLDYLLFELDLLYYDGRVRVLNNGLDIEYYTAKPSPQYENIKELVRKAALKETDIITPPILRAITELYEVCIGEAKEITCPGEEARKTLQTCLALAYSARNDFKCVAVDTVPEDFTVKSH